MNKEYKNIKSKELRKRLIECDKKIKDEMQEWWDKTLPRKGSLLRQLIEKNNLNKALMSWKE